MSVQFVGRGKRGATGVNRATALPSNKKTTRSPPKNFATAQLKEFMAGPASLALAVLKDGKQYWIFKHIGRRGTLLVDLYDYMMGSYNGRYKTYVDKSNPMWAGVDGDMDEFYKMMNEDMVSLNPGLVGVPEDEINNFYADLP